MADPVTLAAVGAIALTEGIKFLYGQAGEALKHWQERKKARAAAAAEAGATVEAAAAVEPVQVALPAAAFEGQLKDPRLHLEAVERLEQDLRDLRAAVADYAQGIDEVDPKDEHLLTKVDALRQAMEAVYGQRIAFKGEPGPPSGHAVVGEARVGEVLGYVAGLRARRIIGGSVVGRVQADRVGPGGEAVGLEVDTIGESSDQHATREVDTMAGDPLRHLADVREISIGFRRPDGSTGSTPVWVVQVDGDLFVRSMNGPTGGWYRRLRANADGEVRDAGHVHPVRAEPVVDATTLDEVTRAYAAKYADSPYVQSLLDERAAGATLRLESG
jgi:hypothetical protein